MNIRENLLLIQGKDKTQQIQWINNVDNKYMVKFMGSAKEYYYSPYNIQYFKVRNTYDINNIIVYKGDMPFSGVTDVIAFDEHIKLIYKNGSHELFSKRDLRIENSSLHKGKSKDVFSYLKELSKNITIDDEESNMSDSNNSFLFNQYEKIVKISPRSVLSNYLSGEDFKVLEKRLDVIFPFGFNISQKEATEKAMKNQLSVIEGPPGTGKTQTILNIIANAYMDNKTVAVVSNNNSATGNVIEKLDKYGVGFISAFLGNNKNKEKFISQQKTEYPNMDKWKLSSEVNQQLKESLNKMQQDLDKMLENKNILARLKEKKDKVIREKTYYEDFYGQIKVKDQYSFINKLSSKKVLKLLAESQFAFERERRIKWIHKVKNLFKYRIFSRKFYKNSSEVIVALLQMAYYERILNELDIEINIVEKILNNYDFNKAMKIYSLKSMKIFKNAIANNKQGAPAIFSKDDLWKNFDTFIKEYPVILSTTHSLRKCISENYLFDYVIIDEASQVDIVTGALAFSCAKNVVVVGDLKQLPNVVSKEFSKISREIFSKYSIPECYSYADESLLSSITKRYQQVPKTLLKEHYRCNPKIIGFCNEKFYNNELIILTENNENKPLTVYKTSKGNHARGTFNQREIDVITSEVIPQLKVEANKQSIGIISPFRKQANSMNLQVNSEDIEVNTVHKYQGREKDIIILSTVANEINDFVDNSNLINVAVSRAINKLILVVSGNDVIEKEKSNIGDLIRYIKYNNYEVIDSKIYSVFDLLYNSYKPQLLKIMKKYKKVSQYDSENLMNIVIGKVLENESFSDLSYAMHQPLSLLIKDTTLLTEEEKRFVKCSWTHTDFIIFNKLDKLPVLVVEVDGYEYHDNNEEQLRRDEIKDSALEKYGIPILRIKTVGNNEYKMLCNKLNDILHKKS